MCSTAGMDRASKKAATRAAVLDAAVRLFAARGYRAVPVEDLAEAAGISRRTFFRYFPTKEATLFADHGDRVAALRGALAGADPKADAWTALRGALTAMARDVMADRDGQVARWRIIESDAHLLAADRAHDLELEVAISEALACDYPPGDARVLAGALMGAVRAVMRSWFEADGAWDLVDRGLAAVDLLERGVRA